MQLTIKRSTAQTFTRIAKSLSFNTARSSSRPDWKLCLARNAARKRKVPRGAVDEPSRLLERTLQTSESEGFDYIRVLNGVTIERSRYGSTIVRPQAYDGGS